MAFHQYAHACTDLETLGLETFDIGVHDRDACIVIVGEDDDRGVLWVSHDHQDRDPVERAHPDHPFEDRRSS